MAPKNKPIRKPGKIRFAPIGEVEQCECVAAPSAERVECPICAKVFAGGNVVKIPDILVDEESHMECVECFFYCDHCNVVIVFYRHVDALGVPDGFLVGDHLIVRNQKDVEHVLDKYPQCMGVLQS